MGNLLAIEVHAANIHDIKSGILVAKPAYERYPSIQHFCTDAGYRGPFLKKVQGLLSLNVDISEKIKPHHWQKLPWRWVVERTIGWFNHSRHLSKDYEITIASAVTMVKLSH